MNQADSVRPGVFIYRPVDTSGDSHSRLVDAGCQVTVGDGQAISAQHGPAGAVHALLGATHSGAPIGRDVFDRWPELRIIAKYTIGTDDVDLGEATARGILVTHAPTEANWGGVAEGTMAFMLALLKKIVARDTAVKSGSWRDRALEGIYLGSREDGYSGITVGIIGLGRIGRRLADLLRPWQVRVIAADPYVSDDVFIRHGVIRKTLDELLHEALVVTVHCNLTDKTRSLIDHARIGQLQDGAILINTSRGAVVELDALCDGLETGKIAGAALDVFGEEPLPAGSRVRDFGDRVLLSPHMVAANRGGTLTAAIPWATDAVLAALRGDVPAHVYNETVIDRWRARFARRALI